MTKVGAMRHWSAFAKAPESFNLDQARGSVANIEEVDQGGGVTETRQINSVALLSLRRLAGAAVVLFALAGIGTLLLFEMRREA